MRRALVLGMLLPAVLIMVTAAHAIPEDSETNGAAALQQLGEHEVMVPGVTRAGQEPAPTATPTPTATPEPTAAPSPTVELSITEVYQGGAIYIEVSHANSGSIHALGRDYALSPAGGNDLAGFIGVDAEDPAGPTTMRIELIDASSRRQSFEVPFTVLETNWPVEKIWFPTPTPGPTPTPDPDPPPPLPDDNVELPKVYAKMSPRQWKDSWVQPVDKPDLAGCTPARDDFPCVSSYFGYQRSINGGAVGGHHTGTDFAAYAGTPVLATNKGTVVLSGLYRVRGNLVVIDHGGGVFSSYGHLQTRSVEVGDTVEQGQTVGTVGSTGFSTGPHLHWELAVNGIRVDGLRWLDNSQGF